MTDNRETQIAEAVTNAVGKHHVPVTPEPKTDGQDAQTKLKEALLAKKRQFTMREMEEDEKLYKIFDKKHKQSVKLPHRCAVCLDLATHVETAETDEHYRRYYCQKHAIKNTSKLQFIQDALRAQEKKQGDLPLHEVQRASNQEHATESQPGLQDGAAE